MALRLVLPIWSLDMSKNKCPIILFVVAFFILCQGTSYGQKVEVGLLSSPRSVGIAIDVGSRSSNTSLVRLYTDLYAVISGKYQTPGVKADYHITFQLAEKTFSDGTRARVIVGPGVCTGYARDVGKERGLVVGLSAISYIDLIFKPLSISAGLSGALGCHINVESAYGGTLSLYQNGLTKFWMPEISIKYRF